MTEYNKLLISKASEMLGLIGRLVACKSRSFDELQIIGEIEVFYSDFEQQMNKLNQQPTNQWATNQINNQ